MQAAAPSAPVNEVAVLLTRRVDLPRMTAGEIVQAVTAAVEAEKLVVMPAAAWKGKVAEPDTCNGKKDCVLSMGKKLGAAVVVGVQVGSVASSSAPISVYVEALRVSDGASVADLAAEVQRDKLKAVAGIDEFARRLREATAQAAVATAPVPPEPKPEPKPEARPEPAKTTTTDTKVVLAVPPPPPPVENTVPPEALSAGTTTPSHTAGYAMVGVAAVTAAVAIGCLAGGFVSKSGLDGETRNGIKYVDMTRAEADSKAGTANALFTTSLVAGLVAAAAGTTAAIVW